MSALDADVLHGAESHFSQAEAQVAAERRLRSRTQIQACDRHSYRAAAAALSAFEPVLDEMQTRRVVEPDLATKIRYRLGWGVPEKYRGWVERDVRSVNFPLRLFINHTVIAAAVVAVLNALIDGYQPWPYLLGFTIAAVAEVVFFRDFQRRRVLEWHEKRWNRQRERDEGPDLRRFP